MFGFGKNTHFGLSDCERQSFNFKSTSYSTLHSEPVYRPSFLSGSLALRDNNMSYHVP
jgi:hypothetical protein